MCQDQRRSCYEYSRYFSKLRLHILSRLSPCDGRTPARPAHTSLTIMTPSKWHCALPSLLSCYCSTAYMSSHSLPSLQKESQEFVSLKHQATPIQIIIEHIVLQNRSFKWLHQSSSTPIILTQRHRALINQNICPSLTRSSILESYVTTATLDFCPLTFGRSVFKLHLFEESRLFKDFFIFWNIWNPCCFTEFLSEPLFVDGIGNHAQSTNIPNMNYIQLNIAAFTYPITYLNDAVGLNHFHVPIIGINSHHHPH